MKVYILFALVVAIQCKDIRFKVCPDVEIDGTASVVSVLPCNENPCILPKGGNSTLAITFTPKGDAHKATVKMSGRILGVWVPFPLPEDDACKFLGADTCPMRDGKVYTLTMVIPISSDYPSIHVPVSIQILNPVDINIVCVEFPVELK